MRRYILQLGCTNYFIGEARNIVWVNGQPNHVTVGDLEIVEGFTPNASDNHLLVFFCSSFVNS